MSRNEESGVPVYNVEECISKSKSLESKAQKQITDPIVLS